ncbi:MAG: hypothetical protein WKF59_16625 [Chitinophagaceae bacterium]
MRNTFPKKIKSNSVYAERLADDSPEGTFFNEIINAILDNGFDVVDDGQDSGLKKSTKPSDNPCKTKTSK